MTSYDFRSAPCKILIVEDSRTQAEHLRYILESEGCGTLYSENGLDALEILNNDLPDLIISDVIMPGIDGFEFCRRIKENPNYQHIPVVLLTSLVNPGDIIKGLEVGASNFITKPYEKDYLFSCLSAIMMNRILAEHEGVRIGIDVYFSGRKHTVTAERKQILGLLLNTFETAVRKNTELLKTESELRELNEQLEEKVLERTENLQAEVTERRRLEEQYAALAAKLQLVLNAAGEGIFGMTADYECTFANATAAAMLGFTQQELTGKSIQFIWQTIDDTQYNANYNIDALEYHSTEARHARAWFRRKDGTRFPVRYTATRLNETATTDEIVVVSFADISEELLAETKIKTQLSQLDGLHQIDVSITAGLDLRITLETVAKMCIRELSVDAVAIYLQLPHGKSLDRYAAVGFQTSLLDERNHHKISHAILSEGPDSLRGNASSLNDEAFYTAEGFTDDHRLPLLIKGEVCGLIELYSRGTIVRSTAWHEYSETLVRHAMIAIDNDQLVSRLEKSNADLAEAYEASLEGWSHALDLRDHETEGHTKRVAAMTIYLARRMGYHDEQLVHIRRGALLHDIGKMGVPDSILLKPGALTDEEWKIMRMHPVYAYELLYPIEYLRPAIDIPYCHHERWDGTGYPRGLKGPEIPKAARLFAVADIWDALQSDRPYRSAWKPDQIREYIKSLSGTHLEPSIVDAFLEIDLQKIGALIEKSPSDISGLNVQL